MAVDAFDVVASSAKSTGRLPGNISERLCFVFVGFVKVVMRALITVGTVTTKEMNVAHVDFLNSF